MATVHLSMLHKSSVYVHKRVYYEGSILRFYSLSPYRQRTFHEDPLTYFMPVHFYNKNITCTHIATSFGQKKEACCIFFSRAIDSYFLCSLMLISRLSMDFSRGLMEICPPQACLCFFGILITQNLN